MLSLCKRVLLSLVNLLILPYKLTLSGLVIGALPRLAFGRYGANSFW
jgi:hypothetical protein